MGMPMTDDDAAFTAAHVCEALALTPDQVCDILRREASRELRRIADVVDSVHDNARVVLSTGYATHLMLLADEFEMEWSRTHEEEDGGGDTQEEPQEAIPATPKSERRRRLHRKSTAPIVMGAP